MNDIDQLIDDALSAEIHPQPHPSFVARVMTAVRFHEQLAPIRFPWVRIGTASALVAVAVTLVMVGGVPDVTIGMTSQITTILLALASTIVAGSLAMEVSG